MTEESIEKDSDNVPDSFIGNEMADMELPFIPVQE